MNNLRNSVQLIGHLGADPEVRKIDNGTSVAKIRLATTENYKASNGEWKEETQWHLITAWDTLAERAAKQLFKGSFVLIQGKLINRSYEDAQGVKKYITEVRATSFLLLDKNKTTNDAPAPEVVKDADGLPF
jgi:single-strand DNA-binding protein